MTITRRKTPSSLRHLPRMTARHVEGSGLSRAHIAALGRLKTPDGIQDYINAIPINFEYDGDTCLPVAEVLRQQRAHCIEGAFVAACALWLHGHPPLLMDLTAAGDDDHVVAVFRHGKFWGAISKSNHVWLRWRDPIYRSLRELALSYFHEYVSRHRKTLWSYSVPFDLRRFDINTWITGKEDCWEIAAALDTIRHYPLLTRAQAKRLRHRDPIEVRAGKLLDFTTQDKKAAQRY